MKTTKWLPWTAVILAHAAIVAVVFAWPRSSKPHGESNFVAEGGLISSTLAVDLTPISEGIRRASSLTLYEGLPHQMWEAGQFKKELATKKTIRLQGFPFYERPLVLAADEVETLRSLSAAGDSYMPYGGPKLCGGYHPDYCLAWKDGEVIYRFLICFGCHEMKLYGPKSEVIVDIREKAFKSFETALKMHRDQRPKRE